jgi:hypothetical protein
MSTRGMIVSVILATLTGTVAEHATTAQVRSVRARNVARAAAVTTTPESRHANQAYRQERWNNASPNQKAVTYNVARTRHQQNVTRQAAGAAAVARRR